MKILMGLCLVCLPLKHLRLNSGFGYRTHPISSQYRRHMGVDLHARSDTVFAVIDGRVSQRGYDPALGIYIRLECGELASLYGHLSQVLVGSQDTVKAGEPIGITGATGRVTGEHLHLSIQYRKRYIDPIQFLYQSIILYGNKQKF